MAKGTGSSQMQTEDYLDIEAQIQKELDALKVEDLEEFGEEDDDLQLGPFSASAQLNSFDKDIDKDVQKYTADIDEYLQIIHLDEQKNNQNLLETEEILIKSEKDLNNGIDELLEKKLKAELDSNGEAEVHKNLLQLRSEILAEIEECEIEEEKDFALISSQECNLAVDVMRPDIIEEIEKFETEERNKLKELREKQKEQERIRAEMVKKRQEEERALEEEANKRSLLRLENVEKSMEKFKESAKEIAKKSDEHTTTMKEIEEEFKREIKEIDRVREKEALAYQQMKDDIEVERNKKRSEAALTIQKKFRGFRIRKRYRPTLENMKAERISRKIKKLEEERLEKERIEKEREEREKLEKERIERERIEREQSERERLEMERIEKERIERERLEKERIEKERIEKERLEREKIEKERIEREKLENERIEREKLEKERIEKERLEREKIEKERIEREKLEKERIEREKLEKERIERERLEKERIEKERIEQERLERERIERERLEKERIEKERIERERLEKDRVEREKLERERLERERFEKERLEKERIELERREKEQIAKERFKKEKLQRENVENDRIETEILEKENKNRVCTTTLPESIEEKRKEWMHTHTSFSESTDDSRVHPVSRSRPRTSFSRKTGTLSTLPNLTSTQILQYSPGGSTLDTVECVFAKDLDGICMESLKDCPNMKIASLENCGIKIFEGIDNCKELKMINLCRNKIDSVIISSNKCLREVILSNNNLSSTNGMDHLVNLEVLDLSANRITRIGSLSACRRLQDLNLSENQLISLKGLENLQRLVSLKAAKNHLSNAKEVESLSLLGFLDLSGNTIQLVPSLKNHVLLRKLYLDENNVTSLHQLSDCWLPSLEILSVSGNSIEELPLLNHLMLLKTIDLRDNVIKESEHLLKGIDNCKRLSKLLISGNPLEGIPDIRSYIKSRLTCLSLLDEEQLRETISPDDSTCSLFESLCLKQRLENEDHVENYSKDIKNLESFTNLHDRELKRLDSEMLFIKTRFNLVLKHLHEHETFGKEDAVPWNERFRGLEHTEEDINTVKTDIKTLHGQIETKNRAKEDQPSKMVQDVQDDKPSIVKNKNQRESLSIIHEKAATKIQALYRGYKLRRDLFAAMTSARYQGDDNDDDDFDYDEEVDLSAFDFEDINQEWKPSSPYHPPASTPAFLPEKSQQEEDIRDAPKYAWESQPATPDPSLQKVDRLNLEFSPEESEATMTIPESGVSRKQEEILGEWGLQNAATADLMLKRAKRMNAAARKKDMMAPDKRYALFKKMHKTNPNLTVRPPSKKRTTERVDYFAAQRDANSSTRLSSFSNDSDYKKQMTYSWVCNQTVLHTDAHHDIINDQTLDSQTKPEKKQSFRNKENVSLPYLDPAIIAGRTVPLVMLTSREQSNSISESPQNRKCSLDNQGKRRHSTEKSRSAPDPLNRSPHIFSGNAAASSRSSSSGSSRGKTKRVSQKR